MDSSCVALLTQDGSCRRGSEVKLKAIADEALTNCPTINTVVVYQRTGSPVAMQAGRDIWWHEAMAAAAPDCACEWMDAEDPLYILYTSGTTGKPKGLVHTTGGYSVATYLTSKYVFDLRPDDVYWVHGRYRMGDGALLRRLRAAAEWGDGADVRGCSELSRERPVLGRLWTITR